MKKKTALIIGAGPAGLTAAYELLKRTDIQPIIFEKSDCMGGISRTVNYKGNRIDIGGHRFFSKSDRVMQWWFDIMPLEQAHDTRVNIFLTRHRKSRILFKRVFFDYPISLSLRLLYYLGLISSIKIAVTYVMRVFFPIKSVKTLEEFYINNFGDELYKIFFRDYTYKVWGRSCSAMSADWGAQRTKNLSVFKVLKDAAVRLLPFKKNSVVETSLITQFFYPKYGPGQLWECVASQVKQQGGVIYTGAEVVELETKDQEITGLKVCFSNGETQWFAGDYVFSSMPIKDLVAGLQGQMPDRIRYLANDLPYRDFLTVGVLINKKLDLNDSWIYIQEPDVKMGRIQLFNNWSPFMVANPEFAWLGLEYFCNENDELWLTSDEHLSQLAINELEKIGLIRADQVIDSVVIRMEKAYPAYWGSYEHFDELQLFLNNYTNLFLIGRNGMHRYNNMDHSMLAAMTAVDLLAQASMDKQTIWQINAEKDYHESRKSSTI